MNNQPIGIFDSGVGGLSILLAAQKILPRESFIYLADQKNFPYGEKKKKKLQELCFEKVNFLRGKGCKVVVIGCNTATVSSINWLRKQFPKIPFIGVEPGVKPGVKVSKTGHVVILSTPVTQKSQRLCNLIKKFSRGKKIYPAPQKAMTINRWCGAYNLGCPGLADLIEKGEIEGSKVTELLKRTLEPALGDSLVDVLVLGCTHYFFVRKSILKLFPRKITIINPAEAVARQIKRVLETEGLLADFKKQKDKFFTSGDPAVFKRTRMRFLKGKL